jgi:hypothetical protein
MLKKSSIRPNITKVIASFSENRNPLIVVPYVLSIFTCAASIWLFASQVFPLLRYAHIPGNILRPGGLPILVDSLSLDIACSVSGLLLIPLVLFSFRFANDKKKQVKEMTALAACINSALGSLRMSADAAAREVFKNPKLTNAEDAMVVFHTILDQKFEILLAADSEIFRTRMPNFVFRRRVKTELQ